MITDQSSDLLTVSEAARVLKVSRITLSRWLKDGRLLSYRVGPRAIRIRRDDLRAVMTLIAHEETAPTSEPEPVPVHAMSMTIHPVTDERQQQAFAALAASKELLAQQLARRGGEPFDESWPLIREEREKRSGCP